MAIAWYSISVVYNSASIFEGYFSVDTTTTLIQNFYQTSNPTTNLLFCSPNNEYNYYNPNLLYPTFIVGLSLDILNNSLENWTKFESGQGERFSIVPNLQQSQFCQFGLITIDSPVYDTTYTFLPIAGPPTPPPRP